MLDEGLNLGSVSPFGHRRPCSLVGHVGANTDAGVSFFGHHLLRDTGSWSSDEAEKSQRGRHLQRFLQASPAGYNWASLNRVRRVALRVGLQIAVSHIQLAACRPESR